MTSKKNIDQSWFTLIKINVFPEKKLYSTRPEAPHTMADMGLPKSPVCLCVTSFAMRDLVPADGRKRENQVFSYKD